MRVTLSLCYSQSLVGENAHKNWPQHLDLLLMKVCVKRLLKMARL
jgi:hypothetical protein